MSAFVKHIESCGLKVASSGRIDRCPVCDGENSASILGDTIKCFRGSCDLGKLGRNVPFLEYLELFEKGASVEKSMDQEPTPPPAPIREVNVELIDKILSEAVQFFHGELLDDQAALNHLVRVRGRTMESIKHFKVGRISNTDKLYNRLTHSYTDDQLEETGLFKFDNNTTPRLPLCHGTYSYPVVWEGKVRNIKSKGETSCYIAKEFAGEDYIRFLNSDALQGEEIILVEGENDAMRLWELGHKNVVGTFGQLANAQIDFVKKSKAIKSIYLCFDNDDAGQKYTMDFLRSFARITTKTVKVIRYQGKDPDVGTEFNWGGIPGKDILAELSAKVEEAAVESTRPEYDRLEATYAKVLVSGKVKYIRRDEPLTNWMDTQAFHQFESRTAKSVRLSWTTQTKPYVDVIVDFAHPGVHGRSFNLFTGLAVKPNNSGTDIFLIYSHIRDILCSGDESIYRYLLDWIAHMFQKPYEVAGTAPVFISKQGAGKGVLIENLLGRIIGRDYFTSTGNGENVTNQFNSIVEGKLLLNVDEASFSGNHQEAGIFKKLIGNETIPIVRKGLEVYTTQNRIRVIISSQHMTAVRVEQSNRRYFVPQVSDKYVYTEKGDLTENDIAQYFSSLLRVIENGGREQFLYDMMSRDLSGYNRFKAPVTKLESEMKEYDVDDVESWFMACVYDLVPQDHNWTKDKDVLEHGFLKSNIPFGLYRAAFPQDKFTKPVTFSKRISQLLGVEGTTVKKINKASLRGWYVDLESLRKEEETVTMRVETGPETVVGAPLAQERTLSWKEFYQSRLDEVTGRFQRKASAADAALETYGKTKALKV